MICEIILAAGCFWSVQYKLNKIKGVIETNAIYSGGHKENPTYEEVCKDITGHAEAVYVKYENTIIPTDELILYFFRIHDPTQFHRQGPDVGSQYRSAIFYFDENQKKTAEKIITELQNTHFNNSKIVTEILPVTKFYIAEEYHQNYYKNKGF